MKDGAQDHERAVDCPREATPVPIDALDLLMPLHLRIASSGHITAAGPTLQKLFGGTQLIGRRFLEIFEVKRPHHVHVFDDLMGQSDCRIRATMRDGAKFTMNGLFVAMGQGRGALVNLSLGISVVEAVQQFDLTSADFAPSDPTVDMLYLIEAKSVALDESKRLNNRLQGAKSVAEVQAFTDMLTGLSNRRAMDQTLDRFSRREAPFGLMHLDLDHFKQVNDTLGHAAGDFVLQRVAEVLTDETRSGDMVARVGGDEFVLIFNGCVDLEVLGSIAARIIDRLEEPIEFEGETCHVSASIGTTLSSFYEQPEAEKMLSDADEALYASKNHGRACHTVFQPEAR
jgi:diguanylate cyclase (GGDEF)-like protein